MWPVLRRYHKGLSPNLIWSRLNSVHTSPPYFTCIYFKVILAFTTVRYYDVCKHQSLIPTVNENLPGLMYSDTTVFPLSQTACSEGQACRFAPTTISLRLLSGIVPWATFCFIYRFPNAPEETVLDRAEEMQLQWFGHLVRMEMNDGFTEYIKVTCR
jgi:hypothetical protein